MSTRSGRPLRFLATVAAGWATLRIVLLWPSGVPSALIHAVAPQVAMAAPIRAVAALPGLPGVTIAVRKVPVLPAAVTFDRPPGPAWSRDPRRIALALAGLTRFDDAEAVDKIPRLLVAPPAARGVETRRSRWSGDIWLLARGGGMGGAGFGVGQLGGSQAGVRLAYTIDRGRRVALAGRLTTPLHGGGREAALGIEWQPVRRMSIRLIAEQRLPLDRAKAGPTLGVVGGIAPTAIGGGFRLEAYGQAGVIDRGDARGFADGAARVTRPLASIGRVRLDWGGGAWGGAQQGAARLDIGPTIGVALPIGTVPARLTLDWRQRIAGDARPGSGFAVSLGADF